MKAEQITPALCEHGEGPSYSPRWPGPRWVDMLAGDVLELQPDCSVERRSVGTVAAVVRARRGGGWLVATERRIELASDDSLGSPVVPGQELWASPAIRSNEGSCDPSGNLYLGSMDYDGRPGAGSLVRIDGQGDVETVVPSTTISNGIAWSPDGALTYYADTAEGRVDVFDWTAERGLTTRRPWVLVDNPDGLAVDSEGGVWVARFGAGTVHRYDGQARLTEVIDLPVSQPTAVAFVGANLSDLVITTSRHGLGAGAEPSAGALFVVPDLGVSGLGLHEYAG